MRSLGAGGTGGLGGTSGDAGTSGVTTLGGAGGGTSKPGAENTGGELGTADGGTSTGGANGGAGDVSESGGTAGSSATTGTCATGADPCSSIPEFLTTEVVDGFGTEYCTVPAFEFNFSTAATIIEYNGDYGRTHYPERAIVRVAWSTNYVHAFIRVIDPYVVKAESLDYIWGADSVELMISANRLVTGSTANDPSTMRIIAAPWTTSAHGMAATVRTSGTLGSYTQLPQGQFAVLADAEGYSVELRVPWPNGFTVSATSRVYFDFALNAAVEDITTGTNVRDAQAIYYQGAAPGNSPCGSEVLPYCDDRSWCPTNLD